MKFFKKFTANCEITKKSSHTSYRSVKLCQKEKVLLWKMYILRKRHWIVTLLEVVVPIVVFGLVVHFKNLIPDDKTIVYDTNPEMYNELIMLGNYKLIYTPSSEFTQNIMNAVSKKLTLYKCNVTLVFKNSETELIRWLKEEFNDGLGVGIIFKGSNSSNELKYTIRTTSGNLDTTSETLYGEQNGYSGAAYFLSGFTTIQSAIDQAYLSSCCNITVPNNTYTAELPSIQYNVVDLVELLLPTIVSLGFTFVMPSLLREIVDEKTSGIKEMMSIMGLKTWLNWFNWVVYSMFMYVPVTFIITGFLTTDSGTGPPVKAHFLVVWFIFLLFTLAFIQLIFATSTFFNNGTIAMIAGEMVWYGITILLDTFVVKVPNKFNIFINALSCLWPSVALIWGLNSINNFKRNGRSWTLSDMFDDGAGGGRVSVGLSVTMLCVDILLYTLITWYMDNVNPGPYGRAKPLTFIFKYFKKKFVDTTINSSQIIHNNYEIPPANLNVGIKIEHLRKTFNHGTLVAVEDVNLDIYEGNITALLGHNGAGKSTTMALLSGFLLPTSGKVIVKGKNIFDNMDEFRSKLGLCPQHNLLFSFFTVREHLIFFGMLKGMTMDESHEEGTTLMKNLHIYQKKNALVSTLSGGMKRKLCLSIALLGDPMILMLDEPTSGLDPESRRQVWDMLLSCRGQRTTILTTHFMEEADVLGDRIAIMDHGQISCYGTPMYLKHMYELHAIQLVTWWVGQFITNTSTKPIQLSPFISRKIHTRYFAEGITNQKFSCSIKLIPLRMPIRCYLDRNRRLAQLIIEVVFWISVVVPDVEYTLRWGGSGYHLNISKADVAPVDRITRIIDQYVTSAAVKQCSPTQLTYSVKAEESSQFPALFSALDCQRGELDITAISLDCTTMEDVFLKVAERTGSSENINELLESAQGFSGIKSSGCALIFHQIIALVYKRFLTRIRSWINSLLFMAIPVILMAASILKTREQEYLSNQPELLISLTNFPGVQVAVTSDNKEFQSDMKHTVTKGGATFTTIPNDTELNEYMEGTINENLIEYERRMIMGFQYNNDELIGEYSPYFVHSTPLTLNYIANSMLHMVNPSHSISVYNHPVVLKLKLDSCDLSESAYMHVYNFPLHLIFLSLGLLILTMNFISFPLKERVTNSKRLQLMTGVSPLLYWFTTMFCDMTFYLLTSTLMVSMVFIFQGGGILTASGYIGTLMLVFILYGFCGITYAYFYSFLVRSSVKASVLFVIVNLVLGTFGGAFLAILDATYTTYGTWRFILSFNPIFTVTSALIHLFSVMYINGSCQLCGSDCNTQDPYQYLDSGPNGKHPHGIKSFLIFCLVDTAVYFGLVLLLEYGVIKKICFFISSFRDTLSYGKIKRDIDVETEKENVKTSSKFLGLSDLLVFYVNELGKSYDNKTIAVDGITFQVKRGDCFGLLGVNGAGKSTTFKMLTGEEIPNHGDATIIPYSLKEHRSRYLSKIGYCPQIDAINKMLSGREMLYVYGMLRGIKANDCNLEVSKWIQSIGLNEYADRPCGSYSGGNKRKLSTAMAFIGDPPVVFLDEPTSGVDPVSRRKLWSLISKSQKAGRAIVLTSHSMEECEAVCNRLTVMVSGQMNCIGSAQHLKQRFGQGCTIKVKLNSAYYHFDQLCFFKDEMIRHFRHCHIKDEHLGLLHYHIDNSTTSLSKLFKTMEHLKTTHAIVEDYIVSDTTLEEVFMSFARANSNNGSIITCDKYTKNTSDL